jgi:hypothetical protein
MLETDLYAPVKSFLEDRGYEVKAEVTGCDVVAEKAGEPLLVVELKTAFNLDLVLQGVDRLSVADVVYLAVPAPDTPTKRKNFRAKQKGFVKLCRRIGVGLLLVALDKDPPRQVEVLADVEPYNPRKNNRKTARLKKEFAKRTGDPNTGGVTRTTIVTAYRQDAVMIAQCLSGAGTDGLKTTEIRKLTGIERASGILQKNHYGWFERLSRGVYGLTGAGSEAAKAGEP